MDFCAFSQSFLSMLNVGYLFQQIQKRGFFYVTVRFVTTLSISCKVVSIRCYCFLHSLIVSLGLLHQVLCILQFKEVPIPDLKCKYLELELHLEKFNLYGAAGLLRASPLVETVIIDVENQPVTSWIFSFLFTSIHLMVF